MRKLQPERTAEFIEEARSHLGDQDAATAERVVEWARGAGLWDWFPGDSASRLAYKPAMGDLNWEPTIIGVDPQNGHVYVQGGDFRRRPPYDQEDLYAQMLANLYAIYQGVVTDVDLTAPDWEEECVPMIGADAYHVEGVVRQHNPVQGSKLRLIQP